MPMSAVLGATPYYVLMDGKRRIGPSVVQLQTGAECSPIYGFSDKDAYDKFCVNSQLVLTPYPLVKGYLRNLIGAPDDGLKLVVVDAAGPSESCLQAATMQVVLEAQENRMTHVTTAYLLVFDQEAEAYRVEEMSV
jgi:hypothetical protein